MKNKLTSGIFLSLIFLSLMSYGQEVLQKCGTSYLDKINEERYPNWKEQRLRFEKALEKRITEAKKERGTRSMSAVIQLPVVVHIIHNNSNGALGGANIPDQRVYDQIDVLNEDFRRTNADAANTPLIYQPVASDIEIEFCLANRDPSGNPTNGINRIYNSTSSFSFGQETYLKSLSYWPSDEYLNIWVCNLSGGLLGYAQFPSDITDDQGPAQTDGVVINYRVFGRNVPTSSRYNLGRTTTHEVGHWLGLYHTWGDGDCSVDDECDDTPNCDGEFYADKDDCGNAPTQCTVRRMIENYMDYSDDACMNLFTADQKDRMQTAMAVSPRRIALLNSPGCCDTCTTTQLIVFPNPTNGNNVTILKKFSSRTDVTLFIYDRLGKKVYEDKQSNVQKYERVIDVKPWADGMYLVRLESSGKKEVFRFIVLN